MAEANQELGHFLRSRREGLRPGSAGLADGRRRRTPGLRREEVAELAGISNDWYVRLEQGRTVKPSVATLDAISLALRLNKAERLHLQALAQTTERAAFAREAVPLSLQRLVKSLPQPAYVTGRRWDMLAWNRATTQLFIDFAKQPEPERNILLYMFTDERARRLFGSGWTAEAKRMLAQFRATYDLWAADPAFIELTQRLRRGSAEWKQWWSRHEVRSGGSGEKLLVHPAKGLLRYEYSTFQSNDDPALKLAIYTPPTF